MEREGQKTKRDLSSQGVTNFTAARTLGKVSLVPCKEGLVFLLSGDRNSLQLLSVKGFSEVNDSNLSLEREGKAPSPRFTTAVILSQQPEGRRKGLQSSVPSSIDLTDRIAPPHLDPSTLPIWYLSPLNTALQIAPKRGPQSRQLIPCIRALERCGVGPVPGLST